LRHEASIGAPRKLRKLSRPVESVAHVEKTNETTDEHRYTQMKERRKKERKEGSSPLREN
jgi:hypothetical protein